MWTDAELNIYLARDICACLLVASESYTCANACEELALSQFGLDAMILVK